MKSILLYIDPGSGSYLVQAIIAGVLGGLFYVKQAWHKIKRLFKGGSNTEQEPDNAEKNDGQ